GLVYMMAGANENLVLIVHNVSRTLGNQLDDRPCKVYTSDMKVRLTPITYVYPDVAVVCGEAEFEDDEHDVLLNPALIIEVLSSSTENYDRGLKFRRYQQLASLQEYVLIAQTSACVERFVRQSDGQWLLKTVEDMSTSIELPSIGCTLALADVYKKIAFDI
ncbi:MAG: Uma2 family endonuclease, partial [Anaerolineae bacterium]|nr:Uma2 family endonuclease [Anaerolineae bacterium]